MKSILKNGRQQLSEIYFWTMIFFLNFLLFVPIYVFYERRTDFFPSIDLPSPSSLSVLVSNFIERTNLDIFRLHFEWFIIILLWVWLKPVRKKWVLLLIFTFYILQLSYMIYEGFIRSFYLLEPAFFNDYFLFKDLTQFVVKNLNLPLYLYLLAPFGLVLAIYIFYKLFSFTFFPLSLDDFGRWSKIGITIFSTLLVGTTLFYQIDLSQPTSFVSSFSAKLRHNFTLSELSKENSTRFNKEEIAQAYNYNGLELAERPDIYLIFVESYGSVLYQRPDFSLSTRTLLFGLDEKLTQNEWFVASNRSEAPTWGGGSWISYTSALAGVRIETHAEYLSLLNQYYDEPFPHLINYLRSQGYESLRLSSISRELEDIQLQRYKSFYGFDEWLRFGDLAYDGPLYGWGPSPPDQYALHFAYEYMEQTPAPNLFFYISQNSHYPWTPLPEIVPDWQSLNDSTLNVTQESGTVNQNELRQNYMASIRYELTTLVNWIVQEGDEDDIFVLVGDHQPARVARRADGFDTPIHIISRNEVFVESFFEHGFVPELLTADVVPNMHHEGFYSLFMTQFFAAFGEETQMASPTYSPLGLIFGTQE